MSRVSSFGIVGFFLVCAYLQTWTSHIILPFPNLHWSTESNNNCADLIIAKPARTGYTLIPTAIQRHRQVIQKSYSKTGTNWVYAPSAIQRHRQVPQRDIPPTSDYQDPSCLQIRIYLTIQQNCVTSAEQVKAIPAYFLHHPGPPNPPPSSWE